MSRCLSVVLVGILSVLAGACQHAVALSDQDKAAIRKTDEEAMKLAVAKPVDAAAYVEKYYAEDAEVLTPNMPPLKGRPAIVRNVASYPPMSVFQTQILDIDGHAGTAYVRGLYKMTMNPPGGSPVTDSGRYVQMWKKQADGGWRVAYELFNSDLPVPGLSVPTGTVAPDAPGETKAMAPIVGHWNIDGKMIVDPQGAAAAMKATQACQWHLGGYGVVCRTTGTIGGAANESTSVMYYDTYRKGYVTTAAASLKDATGSGMFTITPGSFVFTSEFLLGGKPARDRMTLSNMTPDGGTWTYELSMAGGPLKPAGEGTYRKVELP